MLSLYLINILRIYEPADEHMEVVVSILENTTSHGAMEGKTQTKNVKFYNLDAIISIGYRVNSKKQQSSVFGLQIF